MYRATTASRSAAISVGLRPAPERVTHRRHAGGACIGPGRQTGAAAIFLAISLVALLICVGFVLDLGNLYVNQAELRKQAELAALDTANVAGGCRSAASGSFDRQALANAAAGASLLRNASGGTALDGPVVLGELRRNGLLRQFSALESVTNAHAVSVALSRPLPGQLVPLLPEPEAALLRATAQAARSPNVGTAIASFGADVDAGELALLNDFFEAVFGTAPNLTALSPSGLIDSSVELVELVEVVGLSTLEQTLSEPVTLAGLLQILVEALINNGDSATAAVVNTLAANAPPSDSLPLAQQLGVPGDLPETAESSRVRVFDSIRSAALQAQPVYDLTPSQTLPGIATLSTRIELIRPPSTGAGPAIVDEDGNPANITENSQANIDLDLEIQPLGLPLARVKLELVAAQATAAVVDTHCASADDPEHRVDMIARTRLATLRIDDSQPLLEVPSPLSPLLGSFAIRVYASSEVVIGEDRVHGPRTFVGPFSASDPELIAENTWRVSSAPGGSAAGAIASLAENLQLRVEADIPLLGDPLTVGDQDDLATFQAALVATTETALQTAFSGLDENLLSPLLNVIGLDLGGADILVFQFDVPQATLIASR